MNQTGRTDSEIYAQRNVEEEAFGKWFPRIGALAIVLGAGFGFRYAVDQGWIGARLRVMSGLLLGFILMAIGDWARKQEWRAYAAAITGGGVAVLYLTLWAAADLYGLIPGSVTFFGLLLTSGLGVLLAVRHGSQALALISVIGGFVNPFVTGLDAEMPASLYLYVLAIDISVVVLGFLKPWRLLQQVAFAASWVVFELGHGSLTVSLLGATGVFVMFGVVPYLRAFAGQRNDLDDLTFVPINGLIYYLAVFSRLEGPLESYRGPFTLGMAAVFIVALLVTRRRGPDTEWLGASTGVMALIFLALWSPIQLGVEMMALGWALQALLLLGAYTLLKEDTMRWGGWSVLALAGVTHLAFVLWSPAGSVADHYGRFVFVLLIAALYVGTYIERREVWTDEALLPCVAANALTILWLSLEVYSRLSKEGTITPRPADLHLGLTAVWSLYGGLLLGAGIYVRARAVRLASVALLAVAAAKLALHDLWLLDTLQRLVGFAGLGILLLASSLAYNHFKPSLLSAGKEGGRS